MKQCETLVFSKEIDRNFFVSTNKIYSGKHYSYRSKIKEEWGWMFCSIDVNKDAFKQPFPLHLSFVFEFKKKPYDASNCSFMCKILEDLLVVNGFIPDDTPKYIKTVSMTSKKGPLDKISLYLI